MLLKMVALLLFYLVGVFVGKVSTGVVPQNFKSTHDEPSHLDELFINTGTNVSDSNHGNSELLNASSGLADFNNHNASITDFHGISDLNHVRNDIPEEALAVKNISKGSSRSKKKVSKESSRFKKTIRDKSDHVDTSHSGTLASNEHHSEDMHHPDDNVSKKFDHAEHTANHFDNRSDHFGDLPIESNLTVSKSSDLDVNIAKREFINNALDEDVTTDLKHFDHLNDSVITQSLDEVDENVSIELNSASETTLELENDTLIPANASKTFNRLTDNFNHTPDVHNTSKQLKQVGAGLSNSTKLFLNIHNTFMNLNRTDKINSTQLNRIDETSSVNVTNILGSLVTSKIDEENFEKPSGTSISFENFNSSEIHPDQLFNSTKNIGIHVLDTKDNSTDSPLNQTKIHQNETSKDNLTSEIGRFNETNADIQVTEHPDEVESSSELSGELLPDLKEVNINKSESINTEIKEPNIVTENNATQGLFSTLGFDFLLNSELVKNAASAMEVFNFTDTAITDHIIDDKNDMHDLLDSHNSAGSVDDDDQNPWKSDHTSKTGSTLDTESSTRVDHEESSKKGSVTSDQFKKQSETFSNGTEDIETESQPTSSSSLPSKENDSFEDLTTTLFPPILNSSVEFDGTTMPPQLLLNSSVEIDVTTMPPQLLLNSTVEIDVTTMPPQLLLNSSVEFDVTTKLSQSMLRNGTEVAKCPPPGFCIFWFLAQDTCTVNSHCLGSRICCRVGCTKTCVEV